MLGGCVSSLNNEKGNELARVGDDYLYEADIIGLVPAKTSARDSIIMVRNYVDNWVRTQLMLKQAGKNVVVQQLDLEKQIDDYRNSLVIYHYETELIRQRLDTVVSDEEIEDYYKSHLEDFELKENIAKVYYLMLDAEAELEGKIDSINALPDSLLFDSLEVFGNNYAISYFLDTATWVPFNELLTLVPIETYNQVLFLKGNREISISDGDYTYLLTFVDFRIKDETSPLDFEYNAIRKIIINKRKMKLIKQVRKDIYEMAAQNDEFEIYHD
jgi:hypothetical protein